MRPERRNKWVIWPLILIGLNFAVFAASFVGIVLAPYWWLKAGLIFLNGNVIGVMFVIAHDACHNSFTSHQRLNMLLGRLTLAPTLVPYTSWRYTHNYLHHAFTNCHDGDFVWRALSVEDYNALSPRGRWLERTYRTLLGLPLNWIIENWWNEHLFPSRESQASMKKWGSLNFDRLLVAGWLLLEIAVVIGATLYATPNASGVELASACGVNMLLCIVAPFLLWCWLISYVDLLQHTHPDIRRFRSRRDPSFAEMALEGTTHIKFPFPIGYLFHNILEHTAHHVDPAIPMYQLGRAQAELEADPANHVVVEFFSLSYLLRILTVCKLYDYDKQEWVGYDGRPTAPRQNGVASRAESSAAASVVSSGESASSVLRGEPASPAFVEPVVAAASEPTASD